MKSPKNYDTGSKTRTINLMLQPQEFARQILDMVHDAERRMGLDQNELLIVIINEWQRVLNQEL